MKRGAFWIALTFLIVSSLVLASCGTTTTTTTTTRTTTTTTTSVAVSSTTTTTTKVTTTPTSTASGTGNWWDKLGKPQYGGSLVFSSGFDLVNLDPWGSMGGASMESAFMDKLGADNWLIDPAVFAYNIAWRPPEYVGGQLAKSWEMTDPVTLVFHLRQGVHYQNIDPTWGR